MNSINDTTSHLDLDGQIFLPFHGRLVGQGQESDLVQGIWRIRYQLPQENLFSDVILNIIAIFNSVKSIFLMY